MRKHAIIIGILLLTSLALCACGRTRKPSEEYPFTIYYLNTNKEYWKEFGEQWLGCPLVGIDSLDDLPPLK